MPPDSYLTLHNRHLDQPAFVLGTGPSLRRTKGLERLAQEFTFACSRFVLWVDCPFRPFYQVVSDWEHVRDARQWEISGVHERFQVTARPQPSGWTWVPKLPNEFYLVDHGARGLTNDWMPFTNGRSSVLSGVQLALWMGSDPIYLLGADTTDRGHVWDPDDTRNDHGVERHVAQYVRALRDMAQVGRTLIDCSPGGNLGKYGAVPYRPLEEVL